MLTVYCVYWGDKYPPDYVQKLRDQVAKHLTIPHEFRCITDHEFWDVDCIEPVCDYPGWWQKISMFKPGFITGPSLYLDLDVVITGSLNQLVVDYAFNLEQEALACPMNWAQSGHGGCQSSVMLWNGGECQVIWDEFDPEWAVWPSDPPYKKFHGDQCHITDLRDRGLLEVEHTPSDAVVSYKYHCQGKTLPPGAKVVVFHGRPNPHEVNEPWM